MKKRLSLILSIVCFTVALLAVGGMIQMANAAGVTVVGKATIPAGVSLGGMQVIGDGFTPFEYTSMEEQVVYIVKRVDAVYAADGVTIKAPAGYILDATGFKHRCPTHGLETMDEGMIGIPDAQVEKDGITIVIFPDIMNNN